MLDLWRGVSGEGWVAEKITNTVIFDRTLTDER